MKKRIISIILAIMLVLPAFGVFTVSAAEEEVDYVNTEFASEEEKLALMNKTMENDSMEFYINKVTSEIGIRNKATGEIMLSNPYNVSKSGAETQKKQYLSTLVVNYRSISSNFESKYYSYSDAAVYNQISVTEEKNEAGAVIGVNVKYELGKKEMLLPYVLSDADMQIVFEKITANNPEKATARIRAIQTRYTKVEVGSKSTPDTNEDDIWIIKGGLSENIRGILQGYFRDDAKYTFEEMHEAYKVAGYDSSTGLLNNGTYKDHNVGVSYQPPVVVTVNYKLTQDGFVFNVNAGAIEFDEENYVISSISILPYFNVANHETDNGYTFLPDGSGTIIRYEDLRAMGSTDNIGTTVYGPDYAYYTVLIKNQEATTMPVFGGVSSNPSKLENGYFAIIEKGDALATITSANDTYYHSVYSSFKLSATDKYDLADSFSGGSSSMNVVTVNGVERYKGDISLKYVVLTPSEMADSGSSTAKYDTSYIGMANYYRDYLQANGTLTKLDETKLNEYTRLFLEVFGSLQVEEKILTFPVTVSKELTTFSDIMKMHKQLSNIGVSNMTFILTGFANGGLEEKYPTYLKWQKVLGGEDGYEELMEYANANGVEIAPNINFSYSQELKSFSGFKYKKTAAKALDGRYTTKREYDASIQMFQRKGGVVISTDSYDLAYSKFMKSASKYNLTTLATRALGSDLSSDFDEKSGYIFREQSKINTQAFLAQLTGKGVESSSNYNLILDAGNAYTLPYASKLLNVSLDSSRFLNTSEAVPFLGIVLHGSIEFAGNAINMEGDQNYMFLKALENGAGLYFTVAMQNTELLKGTQMYNQYYSVQFATWKNEIARLYAKYNGVMASKQGSYITEHVFMNADEGYTVIRTQDLIDNPGQEPVKLNNSRVVRVEYANGEGFILNYNSYEIQVEYEGAVYTIPALDFVSYGMN